MLTTLLISIVAFFLLTIYSILQSNLSWFHINESRFWSLKILDTTSAATLFVTLVGALLVRHQFAISVLPRINYVSDIKTTPQTFKANHSSEAWQVEIRNTGLGSAIIDHIDYFLDLENSKETKHDYTFNSLITKLAQIDLLRNSDYSIFNMSKGFSLAPKDEYVVFEIKTNHLAKFKRLTMVIYFQGQLGNKYCREISLLAKAN